MKLNKIYQGDCLDVLKTFANESIDCVITSPPYWALRDYGVSGQLGLESTFQEYINKLCDIFDEVKRVLKKSGTCWVNIGDTYCGNKEGKTDNKVCNYLKETTVNIHKKKGILPEKSLCQIPSRFAIEMSNRGWILRNEIIWHKPNCMPQSVQDRFTVDFEKVFLFVKNKKYFFDNESVKEPTLTKDNSNRDRDNTRLNNTPGRTRMNGLKTNDYDFKNKRCVWTVNTRPYKDAHFATYPEKLIIPMVKSGCPLDGVVLDIFMGAGTTGLVAKKFNRNYIGIELNQEYVEIAEKRISSILF